jgi:hypothetical protein
LSLVLDDPRHILEHFLPPLFLEEVLSSLYGENNLNIDLGKCTCHVFLRQFWIMTSLRDLFLLVFDLKSYHPFGVMLFNTYTEARIIVELTKHVVSSGLLSFSDQS